MLNNVLCLQAHVIACMPRNKASMDSRLILGLYELEQIRTGFQQNVAKR